MRGFPRAHCHVVASRVRGDVAYVLLDTGSADRPYLYGVHCERRDGRWTDGTSGNGPGWSLVGQTEDRGTLTIWDHAPRGADRVRVEFEGVVIEEAVQAGVYLAVWWNVPCPEDGWPRVRAFRVRGVWLDEIRTA